jgi:hypothetical protein
LRRIAGNIPVYQVPLQAIDPKASELVALNFQQNAISDIALDGLIDFIVHTGIPHLNEMADLDRISDIIEREFDGHLAIYLVPVILLLRGDEEGAKTRMQEQSRVLAKNPRALRIYRSFCSALQENTRVMPSK